MTAGDGPYREPVDRLGPERRRFGLGRKLTANEIFPTMATTMAAIEGNVVMVVLCGLMVVGAGARRLRTRPIVAIHVGGLRAPTYGPDLLWDEVTEVRYDGARGEPTITLGRTTGPPLTLPDAPDGLLEAVEAALLPRQLAELRARLARGLAIEVGRYRLDRLGMSGPGAALPWDELGTARRVRDRLVIEASIGPFDIALANVVNPGAVIALIGELGRPTRPGGAP